MKSKHPILLVGSGKFHAIQLALQGNTVYVLEGKTINKLSDDEISKAQAKRKAALARFLTADSIGILVSTKPGQENLKEALNLKRINKKQTKRIMRKDLIIFPHNFLIKIGIICVL